MSYTTLHICNLDENCIIDNYKNFISASDAVLFYANKISNKRQNELAEQLNQNHLYYFTNASSNYNQWLELVNNANKTLTWK